MDYEGRVLGGDSVIGVIGLVGLVARFGQGEPRVAFRGVMIVKHVWRGFHIEMDISP